MKKVLFGLIGAALVASTVMVGGTANAAPGDEIIVNGTFDNVGPGQSLVGATTDFTLANAVQGSSYGGNTMYDEGRYIVGTNPFDYHVLWANQPSADNKMFVNGFTTSDSQIVWQQSDPGIICPAGDQVTYDFSAQVANILPLSAYSDGGAAITVNINGVDVANVDLTSNDPDNPVTLSGNLVPAMATMTLTIKNGSTVKIGNDFSLDNISLKQVGGCQSPVAATFDVAPTAPTCDADGFLDTSVFPIVRTGYTLTVDRDYNGPGVYTITATANPGFFLTGSVSTTVTVLPKLNNCCVPTVTEHQWYNWTGGPVTSAPAQDDPKWHAVSGNPRSDIHKWENHPTSAPYQAGVKGHADWFKWVTTPGVICPS